MSLLISVVLSGCAGGGAGPLGLGAVMGQRNLAAAEPLFGKKENKCLGNSEGLLATVTGWTDDPSDPPRCRELFESIRSYVDGGPAKPDLVPNGSAPSAAVVATTPLTAAEKRRRRNEIIDALLASSNRKCTRYSALLKNADGGWNATMSLGAILTGGLGSFVGGAGAAKALAGTAGIFSGSRAAVNEVYLTNQTIHVLAAAFEKARARQRAIITNREACDIDRYTITRGIEDAFQYHGYCSLVTGLEQTVLAVERSDAPGLDAMRKSLAEYAMLVKQAAEVGKDQTPTPVTPTKLEPLDWQAVQKLDVASKKAEDDLGQATIKTTQRKLLLDQADAALAKTPDDDAAKTLRKQQQDAYDTAIEAQRQAQWTRDGAFRDLQSAARKLANAATVGTPTATPESRVCPFDVKADS